MPENIEFFLGKLSSQMEGMEKNICEISYDVKILLASKATTDERLATGVQHFLKNDALFDEHETRISNVENRKLPWGKLGAIISLGFLALGILIGLK